MNIEQQKKRLRQEILLQRLSLTEEEIKEKSDLISEKFIARFKHRKDLKVMAFMPFRNEVDTKGIITEIMEQNGSIILPRVVKESHTIRAYHVENLATEVETGTWGISEPLLSLPEVPASEIDIVLVPGIAFDRQGNRLGYGGGFYDRFLPMTKALKLGICFDFQVCQHIPAQAWDEKLDDILTELGFISRGGK